MQKVQGWSEKGNTLVVTSGLSSTTKTQGSFPLSTVTVYISGTLTLASLFSDNALIPTPKANPFVCNADGTFSFYAVNGRYDIAFSGGGIVTPFTLSDFLVFDPNGPTTGWYDFLAFGGIGNGSVDDGPALSTLANVTIPSTGGTLYIPPGTYKIGTNTTIPSNVTLYVSQGATFSISTGVTLTINGTLLTGFYKIFTLNGTGVVRFGSGAVKSNVPQWWGAKSDGSAATATAAAINAAFAALPQLTNVPDTATTSGGGGVYLPGGTYAIDTIIQTTPQAIQTFSSILRGDGKFVSTFLWKGAANSPMLQVSDTAGHSELDVEIYDVGFDNPAISGSGVTAVRTLNVSGIQVGNCGGLIIERCFFNYMTNGIVLDNATTEALNNTKIISNRFANIYNQTSPVVNPLTDALVAGRGNAIYFGTGSAPGGGIIIEDNYFTDIQAYMLDGQGNTGAITLTFRNNLREHSFWGFTRECGIRLSSFASVAIVDNQFDPTSVGGANLGSFIDLGTTALGSSNISGFIIQKNYFSVRSAVNGAPTIKITFANGGVIQANTFFGGNGAIDPTQPAIKLYQTATNIYIGPNDWPPLSFGPNKLSIDSGPSNPPGLVVTDPAIGMTGLTFDPEQTYELMEDFEDIAAGTTWAAATTVSYLRIGWTSAATGTYSFIDGSAVGGAQGGVVRIVGDGAAAGGINCCTGTFPFRRGSGPVVLKARWAQRGTGAANRFIGFVVSNSFLLADNNSAIYFRHTNAGNIIAVIRGVGVDTATLDTGVATANGVFHSARMVIKDTAGTNGIDVYVDGVYKGNFGSGLVPASGFAMAAGSSSTVNTDGLDVDYIYASQRRI